MIKRTWKMVLVREKIKRLITWVERNPSVGKNIIYLDLISE